MADRKLYILGAGNFGREVESHLDLFPPAAKDWKIAGFLDDTPEGLKGRPSDYKVVGHIQDFKFMEGDLAILAVSTPEGRRSVYEALKDKVEFLTYIAPDALIGKFTKIGASCFIGPRVVIGPNVVVEDGVVINSGSMIGHDVRIGRFSALMANNNIAGHCKIGTEVFCASSVTVIPKRKICDGTYIGAGSVVIQHLNKGGTVFGNPATYI